MGWEIRRGGFRCYTRSKKRGGKVIREYVGTGVVGELAAAADALQRAGRRARAEALQAEKARVRGGERLLRQVSGAVDTLTRATLMLAGFFRHDHGEWRCRADVYKH